MFRGSLEALPGLPPTMQAADHRARQYQRAVVDLTEAVIMAPRVGETFEGAIIDVASHGNVRGSMTSAEAHGGIVMLREPAIEAGVTASFALDLGADVTVQLVEADPAQRTTRFEIV